MKERFREKLGLNLANRERLKKINEIIEQYRKQGYRLTLRQLYYQLVSKDIIPNKVSEYAKLSGLLVKGRMAGEVDWNGIEDRLRIPKIPYWVTGIADAISDTIEQYRLDRMDGQDCYIEVWCDKDALSNVLYRVTAKYHIRLMVNRGYSSCTAMHDAYERFMQQKGKELYILYLGDHDPSGLDMIRDVIDREYEFGISPEVRHLAITKPQIERFNPPPNPTKFSDPRGTGYAMEHGNTCWEVDALPPEELHRILGTAIEDIIDMGRFEAMLQQEHEDKEKLKKFLKE